MSGFYLTRPGSHHEERYDESIEGNVDDHEDERLMQELAQVEVITVPKGTAKREK